MQTWQEEALLEVARDIAANLPQAERDVRYIEFLSYSAGRGKRRKYPREVRLVTFGGNTVALGTKLTRKIEYIIQDVMPDALLENNSLEIFIARLKKINRYRK